MGEGEGKRERWVGGGQISLPRPSLRRRGVGVSSPSRPVSCLVRWLPCLQGVWSPLWCCREVVTKAGLTRRLGNHDHSHGSASKSGRRARALPDIVPLPPRRSACSDIREPPTATARQTDYPRIRQDNYSEAEQSLSVLLPTPPGETRHRNAADGQSHTHKACTKPKVPRRRAGCIAFSPPPTNIGGTRRLVPRRIIACGFRP